MKPTNNVFFDVSDADFSIAASGAATLAGGAHDLRAADDVRPTGGLTLLACGRARTRARPPVFST